MYIILVRHGQTQLNAQNITQGSEVDPPINILGKKQAKLTGKYLAKHYKINKIYSSPLLRAKQTANLIAKQLNFNKNIILETNLKEQKKGIFSGLNKKEIKKIIKNNKTLNKINKLYDINNLNFLIKYDDYMMKWSKIIKSENIAQITARCMKIFNKIKKNKGNILIVSHGSFIKFLISKLTNINNFFIPHNIIKNSSPNCHITIIEIVNNKPHFLKIRDNQHLKKLYF